MTYPHKHNFIDKSPGASIVPIPPACRRAVRSSGTPPGYNLRRPEVPQALEVF
jgi:hypothetical protein